MVASDFIYPARIYRMVSEQPGGAMTPTEKVGVLVYEPVVAWDMVKSDEKFQDDVHKGFDYPWIWFRHPPPGLGIVQGYEIEVDYYDGLRRFVIEGVISPNHGGFDAWCLKCEQEVVKEAC